MPAAYLQNCQRVLVRHEAACNLGGGLPRDNGLDTYSCESAILADNVTGWPVPPAAEGAFSGIIEFAHDRLESQRNPLCLSPMLQVLQDHRIRPACSICLELLNDAVTCSSTHQSHTSLW